MSAQIFAAQIHKSKIAQEIAEKNQEIARQNQEINQKNQVLAQDEKEELLENLKEEDYQINLQIANIDKRTEYFKLRILPKINEILQKDTSNEEKLAQITEICRKFEQIYRRIQAGITNEKYQEILKTATTKTATRPDLQKYKDAAQKLREALKDVDSKKLPTDFGQDLADFTSYSKKVFDRARAQFDRQGGENHISYTKHRTVEELEEKGLLSPKTKRKRQEIITEFEQELEEVKKFDNFKFDVKNQDNKSEIAIIPATTIAPTAKPIQIATINQEFSKIKQEVQKVITKTANNLELQDGNGNLLSFENKEKLIKTLLEALSQYAKEHISGIDEKDVQSIMKGGKDAGFSKWQNEEEFQNILKEKALNFGVKLNFENEITLKTFQKISTLLQENSVGIIGAAKGKTYILEDGSKQKNMTRSWRIAMLYKMEEIETQITASL